MHKVIGNQIRVFLKTDKEHQPSAIGLLVDVTEGSLYIQGNRNIYIVPRDNINYCTTDVLPRAERILETPDAATTVPVEQPERPQSVLSVHIDDYDIIQIPVPPTFNLEQWHDGIAKVVMGNPDVCSLLANKIQESWEYRPGDIYIATRPAVEEPAQPLPPDGSNTFSMGGTPDVSNKFLSGIQMAKRLSEAKRRGNNEEKSNGVPPVRESNSRDGENNSPSKEDKAQNG